MSDFKAKMYQIQFRLGLRPRPRWRRWGSLQRSPDPLAALRVPTSKGRGGDETQLLHAPLSHISGYAPELSRHREEGKQYTPADGMYSAPLKLKLYGRQTPSLTAKPIGSAVLFYSKTGFWPSYCQISTDLDKILHKVTLLLLYGIHLWADFDLYRDRRVDGSRPN